MLLKEPLVFNLLELVNPDLLSFFYLGFLVIGEYLADEALVLLLLKLLFLLLQLDLVSEELAKLDDLLSFMHELVLLKLVLLSLKLFLVF